MIVWQTRKFETTHIDKLGKFMLMFWFFTLSMYDVFYSDICKKKYMYWDSYSKEFRYALKRRGKAFPFSTHVKMFHEVSKAPWRLCLCYNVYPTQTIPNRTGRLPEMNYKNSRTYNFLQDQEISRIWLNKFTLFSCLLLISSLDPGQHRQNAGPDLDSNGPDLDPKYLTPWLWWCSWKNSKRFILKKISRWKQMHEKSPSMQIINRHLRVRQKHVIIDYKMPCCKQCQYIYDGTPS